MAVKKAAPRAKSAAKVRVGVIGVGIGTLHLSGYHKHPEAEIVAICDADAKRAEAAAAEYNVPNVCTDYREMLKLEEIDAVSVCLPNYLHAPVTLDCFKARKHVVCEKPLAMNAKEGERMVAAAKAAGRLFMIAVNNRFRGDTGVLKQYIDAGDLGDIYCAKAGWIRRAGIPRGWFGSKKFAGGGPLIDLGVHMLDLSWYLMGKPKPLRASGVTFDRLGSRGKGMGGWGVGPAMSKVDVEDLATALIRFEGGKAIQLEVSWATHIQTDRVFLDLYGEEGGASLEPQLRIFTEKHGSQVDLAPAAPSISGHEAEIMHFVDAILGKVKLISPGEDGLAIQRMLDAIYLSAKTGKEVAVG